MQPPPTAIDRQSPTPYYEQLVAALEARIEGGELAVGQKLPSENDLCAEFGLSRATVRQALQVLESRGGAQRVPGRGVFVSESSEQPSGWLIQGPEGFLENALGNGNRAVTTHVLSHGPVLLPPASARLLDVPEDSTGYELVRMRAVDGTPALFSINHLPPPLVPVVAAAEDVLGGTGSLSEAVRRAGYVLGGAQRTIRADRAADRAAQALGIEVGSPLLQVRSTSWTPGGVRFDVYETWVRSDVIPLEISVGLVPLPR